MTARIEAIRAAAASCEQQQQEEEETVMGAVGAAGSSSSSSSSGGAGAIEGSIMAPIVPARLMTCLKKDLMVHINFAELFRLRRVLLEAETHALVTTSAHTCKFDFDLLQLSEGGRRVLTTPNAGGTSEKSEALSFEILSALLKVRLAATEMEIDYFPHGSKKTDYAVEGPDGQLFGVSVTRANNYCRCRGKDFGAADARHLLHKKLDGIIWSTANVNSHKWERQILHILAADRRIARILRRQYRKLSKEVKSNSMVVVSTISSVPGIW